MDVVDVADVRTSVARFGNRYLERVYTRREIDLSRAGRDSRVLAAFFAAKEATLKALRVGDGPIDWRSIEVVPEHGAATATLTGAALVLATEANATGLKLSMACSRSHASAIAIVEWSQAGTPSREG